MCQPFEHANERPRPSPQLCLAINSIETSESLYLDLKVDAIITGRDNPAH